MKLQEYPELTPYLVAKVSYEEEHLDETVEISALSRNAERLWAGLERLGLEPHAPLELRLATLTTVHIPEGVDGKAFTLHLLNQHGIEVGGGLGALAGKVWRIGLMGYNSREENVDRLLNLLEQELPAFRVTAPAAAAAVA